MSFSFHKLAAILLSSYTTVVFAQTNDFSELMDIVTQTKQTLPKRLSAQMVLNDLNYNKKANTLTYSTMVTDPAITPDKIDQEPVIDQVCYNPKLRQTIKQGITVSFLYYTADTKQLLKDITITDSLCETTIKTFDLQLNDSISQIKSSLPQALNDQFTLFDIEYDKAKQEITAKAKANAPITAVEVNKENTINLVCKQPSFAGLTQKNITFSYKYFTQDAKQLIKEFSITHSDCQTVTTELNKQTALDEKLTNEAELMKSQLDKLSSDVIQLVDVSYDPKKRTITNKAVIKNPNITAKQLNPNANIAALCSSPNTRQTISQGVSYQYNYFDVNKKPISSFTINREVCQTFDKTSNILLQK